MFNLPQSTEFNKRIPKQKFYDNLSVTPAIKRIFVEQIKTIHWANKIAATTVNVAEGEAVKEIEVFIVSLTKPELDEKVLHLIDKEIPYHIVFLLEYDGRYQVWTAYKEEYGGNSAFKVNQYYHTEWVHEDDFSLRIEGLNTDDIYKNFIYQIAGNTLQAAEHESLQCVVERDAKIKKLRKQIEILQAKIRKEKQLNVQIKLNYEIKKIRKELNDLL